MNDVTYGPYRREGKMFIRSLCFLALVVVPMALPAQPPTKPAAGEGKAPKNETVMSPGMKIQATTSVGEIVVTAVDELTRSYTWEGAALCRDAAKG
jgi:hypothetical protein